MTEINENADSVRYYHSGALSVDAAQTDPLASLGGNRSSTEIEHLAIVVGGLIPGVTIDYVAGENGPGLGSLTASSINGLRWTAPDGVQGTEVTILDGESKIIEDQNNSKYVRVTRNGTADLAGTMTVTLADFFNNVIGGKNVSSAEAAAGTDYYLAFFGVNGSISGVNNIKAWLVTLSDEVSADSAVLSATGAGSIVSTSSLATFPKSGAVQIFDVAGDLRETVYYASRTDSSIAVPATGRGLFGTTEQSGELTDTFVAVPMVEVGFEAPAAGVVQSVADINTAPTGIVWNAGLTPFDGVDIGDIVSGGEFAIWIHFTAPAGASATPLLKDIIQIRFDF